MSYEGLKVELPGNIVHGLPGENGATFTPYVDNDGYLHWTNDKELPNPAPVDIVGAVLDAITNLDEVKY